MFRGVFGTTFVIESSPSLKKRPSYQPFRRFMASFSAITRRYVMKLRIRVAGTPPDTFSYLDMLRFGSRSLANAVPSPSGLDKARLHSGTQGFAGKATLDSREPQEIAGPAGL